ncbi:hypothetical protein D3C87_1712650 [compost metagenome]
MAEDDYRAQAILEVINRIAQTGRDVVTQTIAGHPDDKQVVRAFGKDQLDRNPRIGTADNCRKRLLFGCRATPRKKADIMRVHGDVQLCGW